MFVPNADRALVPPAKLIDYLLSFEHPVGRTKAALLSRFGFAPEEWTELAEEDR